MPHSRLCQVVPINCLASACTALCSTLFPMCLWLQGWVDLIDVLITELGNQVRTACLLNPAACSQRQLAVSGVPGSGSSELLLQRYSTGMQQTSLHDHHSAAAHALTDCLPFPRWMRGTTTSSRRSTQPLMAGTWRPSSGW